MNQNTIKYEVPDFCQMVFILSTLLFRSALFNTQDSPRPVSPDCGGTSDPDWRESRAQKAVFVEAVWEVMLVPPGTGWDIHCNS